MSGRLKLVMIQLHNLFIKSGKISESKHAVAH